MTVNISVSITDQQAEYARKQVAEGRFSSTSAVIQQALEAKRKEDEEYEAEKEAFRTLLERRAKGGFVPLSTFRENMMRTLDQKAGTFDLDD